jgi:hypothetical protein
MSHGTEISPFATQTDAATMGHEDDLVVKGIIDIRQSLIRAGRELIDLGRALHIQGFVRTFTVEDLDKVVEPGLLLKKVSSWWLLSSR